MTTEEPRRLWTHHRSSAALVVVLLVGHFGLGLHVASYNSVTNDEFWHIPTGLWNLSRGRFHYDNLNPPLLRVMAAVPLVIAGAATGDVDESADKETRADTFVAANRDRYSTLVFLARIVPLLWSVIIGGVLATWALRAFGPGSAVLATTMWTFSPNVLGHASLVTGDVAAAGAMLVVIKTAWEFAGDPQWKRAIWLGLWLGVAQLVKFTCLLAIPLVPAIWALRRWWSTSDRYSSKSDHSQRRKLAVKWLAVGCIGLVVLNAGYLFNGTGRPFGSYNFSSTSLKSFAAIMAPLKSVPVPFPVDYIEGIDHQRHVMEGAHPVYLNRKLRFEGGFRDYYLKAWWYKTPHATQLLCLLSLVLVCWPGRRNRNIRLQVALLLPAVLLLVVASVSSMQFGIRYLLPAFPFVFLFASQIASTGTRRIGIPQIIAGLLAIGIVCSVRFHPHHLGYFNEFTGGPQKGNDHLLDSNIDWGQELLAIRQFADDHRIERLGLAYFGSVNPADLGINFMLPVQSQPPEIIWPRPEPGIYAVSVNFLGGMPGMVREPDGATRQVGHNQFGYFRAFIPVRKIGNSIYIYDLSPDDIAKMPTDR